MFSLFGGKKEERTKTILVLDIGSGSVGCALVELTRDGAPTVILTSRAESNADFQSVSTLLAGLDKAFSTAAERLRTASIGLQSRMPAEAHRYRPTHAAVFLRAPWTEVTLQNLRFARPNPFKVNPQMFERMLAEYLRKDSTPEDEEVIERTALGIRLNGYAVPDVPQDATVLSAELTALAATAPRIFLEQIRKAVSRYFGVLPVTFHVSSIASAHALLALQQEESAFLLVEVGADTTEFLLVLDRTPAGRSTIPLGTARLFRTIMTHAGMGQEEARSAIRIAKEPQSPMRKNLAGTLDAAQKEYLEQVRKAISGLALTTGSAGKAYLLCDEPAGHWLFTAIQGDFARTLVPGGMELTLIGPSLFGDRVKTLQPGVADPFIAALSLFADARFDEHRTFNFRLTR